MLDTTTKKNFVNLILSKNNTEAQKEIEAKRIDQWRNKVNANTPCFKINQKTTEDDYGKKTIALYFEPTGTEPINSELTAATLSAILGTTNHEYASCLLEQTIAGFFQKPHMNSSKIANAITGSLLSLNPKDEIEGMLCSRLVVLHNQYMEFISRTVDPEQTNVNIDLNINRATKLMRLYNETLDALSKHRRKGEQKVTVQHVNISDGGQAIVTGQMSQGEGGK